MAENDVTSPQQDRRLQTLVYELDKRAHALELSDGNHKLEIAFIKGEIAGIRSSTASSFEVKAASDLINQSIAALAATVAANDRLMNERLDQVRNDQKGTRKILWFAFATLVGMIVSAIKFKFVVMP